MEMNEALKVEFNKYLATKRNTNLELYKLGDDIYLYENREILEVNLLEFFNISKNYIDSKVFDYEQKLIKREIAKGIKKFNDI